MSSMREVYQNVFKDFFYDRLVKVRADRHLTQAAMAKLLFMEVRSYIDLDHGVSCYGALTLALYLIYCCDATVFLGELRQAFESAGNTL